MNSSQRPNMPQMGTEYFPYFYSSGRHLLYDRPRPSAPLEVRYVPAAQYDFTSDLFQKRAYPVPQTVEQVIRRGYLSVPKSEPETSLITDRKNTARLGLDDVIGQIRRRYDLHERNLHELEISKCAAINCLYRHEAHHGPANSKVEYSVEKRLNDLYQEQREERTSLWKDISRLRLLLPENAQQYLSAYRKVSILEDDKGDML